MKLFNVGTLLASLAVALLMTPGAARAEHGGWACRQDIQALCPDVTPGPGNFRGCLQALCPQVTPGPAGFGSCLQQAAQSQGHTLSSECQDQLAKMQAKIAAFQQACGDDVKTYCSDVTGPRGIFKCLRDNQENVSASCQDVLAQHHDRHHHHHECQKPTPGAQ